MNIRRAEVCDAAQIAGICNFYIENTHSTFEMETIDSEEMRNRLNECFSENYPFYVCEENGEISGYAYGRCFRPRRAYRHSIEISVYVKTGCEKKKIGTKLYEKLIPEIKNGGFHAIIAGIALPNDASVKLHEKFGMEKVAHFREVGFKFGRWIDVGYWELINL